MKDNQVDMTADINKQYDISDLLKIMTRLRDPQSGCPWDLKQDFGTIVKHFP